MGVAARAEPGVRPLPVRVAPVVRRGPSPLLLLHPNADGKVPVPGEYQDIRRIFLEPEVTDDYALRWESVDPESVKKILCDKHAFSVDRIDTVLSRIVSKNAARSQKNLDSWA